VNCHETIPVSWVMKRTSTSCNAVDVRLIGCCGAYCKTCPPLILGYCKGCKLGYDDGERDLTKAKCKMKVCCFGLKKQETCAECPDYGWISLLTSRERMDTSIKKYKESLDFIHTNGYAEFIERGKDWKKAYGKL
jgi:hypothetical protein